MASLSGSPGGKRSADYGMSHGTRQVPSFIKRGRDQLSKRAPASPPQEIEAAQRPQRQGLDRQGLGAHPNMQQSERQSGPDKARNQHSVESPQTAARSQIRPRTANALLENDRQLFRPGATKSTRESSFLTPVSAARALKSGRDLEQEFGLRQIKSSPDSQNETVQDRALSKSYTSYEAQREPDKVRGSGAPAVKREPSFARKIMSQSKMDYDERNADTGTQQIRSSSSIKVETTKTLELRALSRRSSTTSLFSRDENPTKDTLTRILNEADLEALIESTQSGLGPTNLNLRAQLDMKLSRLVPNLFDAIGASNHVQALNVGYNAIVDTASGRLAQALYSTQSLTTLHLGSIGLSEASCLRLVAALRGNSNSGVRELFLGRNKVGRETAEALAEGLSCGEGGLVRLKVLSLSNNRIGDDGGAALCDALLRNRHLRVLDVGSNLLGSRTCTALVSSLRANTALRELRIERNPDLETERLSDVILALVSNEHSALRTVHSLEPLAKFCWDPAIRRNSEAWDNPRVMRFLRDVRRSCGPRGENASRMFPIDVRTWERVEAMARRKAAELGCEMLHLWLGAAQRAAYGRGAADAMVRGPGRAARARRFWREWRGAVASAVAEREKGPGLQRKVEGVARRELLVGFGAWRMALRHRGWLPCGRRCHVTAHVTAALRTRFGAEALWEALAWRQARHAGEAAGRGRGREGGVRSLEAWRGVVRAQAAAVAAVSALQSRCRARRGLGASFGAWSARAGSKALLRRKGRQLGMQHPRAVAAANLRRWAEAARGGAQLKRSGARLGARHGAAVLQSAWGAWGAWGGARHEGRRKEEQATRAVRGRWFRRWVARRREAAAEGGRWQLAGRARRRRLARVAAAALRAHAARSVALRSKAGRLVGSGARHVKRRSMRRWAEATRAAEATRGKVQLAQGKGQARLGLRVLQAWEEVRLRRRRAGVHERRVAVARVVRGWRGACAEAAIAREGAEAVLGGVAAGRAIGVESAWAGWRRLAAEAAGRRAEGERKAGSMQRAGKGGKERAGLQGAFLRWMSLYLEAVRKDAVQVQRVEARERLRRVVAGWEGAVGQARRVRVQMRRNAEAGGRRLVQGVWAAWAELPSGASSVRVAQGMAVLRLGCRVARERRMQAENVLARLARRAMLDERKAFAGWHVEVLGMLLEDERVARQARHFRRWFDKGVRALSLMSCFTAWRSLYAVPLSTLKGSLIFRGGLPERELRAVALKSESPLPAELLSMPQFAAAGAPARVLAQVLEGWWERKEGGSVEHAVELHRFWSFLSGQWAGAHCPLAARFAAVVVVPRRCPLRVTHADSPDGGQIRVEVPAEEEVGAMERRLRRAVTIGLDLRFPSLLPPPCPLLAAAKHFCERFLEIPAACLDPRGDHEAWPTSGHQPAHVRMLGQPPKPAPVPEGWARVGLRLDGAVAEGHDVWGEWHVSYHGTRRELVKEIVMSRMLLLPGDLNCRGKTVHAPPGHLGHALHHSKRLVILPGPGVRSAGTVAVGNVTLNGQPFGGSHGRREDGFGSVRWKPMGPEVIEEYDRKEQRHKPEAGAEEFLPSKYFFTSPSVRYASQPCFSVPFTWQGRKAQVLLQTRQCPRFVRVAHTRKAPSIQLEECFRPDEVSWFTRVYGPASIMVTGVLFRFVDE